VAAIQRKAENRTLRELAAEFGASCTTISNVLKVAA
jgi:hypothetical protein